MEIIGFALIGMHVVFCTLVTRRVLASHFYEPNQQRIQIAIAWLIPVLGVAVVWLFLTQERPRGTADQEAGDDDVEESIFADRDTSEISPTSDATDCGGSE